MSGEQLESLKHVDPVILGFLERFTEEYKNGNLSKNLRFRLSELRIQYEIEKGDPEMKDHVEQMIDIFTMREQEENEEQEENREQEDISSKVFRDYIKYMFMGKMIYDMIKSGSK